MRIARTAALGLQFLLVASAAHAQDAPPSPPPPGEPGSIQAVPPPPPAFSGASTESASSSLAGWHDGFFLRDADDWVHLYPQGLLQFDFLGFAGDGVSSASGTATKNRFTVRRLRLELGGDLFRRWSFYGGVELGTEQSAQLTDAWINYRVLPFASFQFGQFDVPFTMENRTRYENLSWMDRSLATRFLLPTPRDTGVMMWGDFNREIFGYELGVFGGDGQNNPSVDDRFDFIGRVYARPLATDADDDFGRYLQIGVSARHGDRNSTSVDYDLPALVTNQGATLFQPDYTDSQGRPTRVLPSGAENAVGVELRMRVGRFALQGEGYYDEKGTREAIAGFESTNTERLGRLKAGAWYVQASAWPVGDKFLNGEPGIERPTSIDFTKPTPEHAPRGLEVLALVSNVTGHYDGASRGDSTADANTPNADFRVWQIGAGMNYWHTRFVHLGVNYLVYLTPHGDDASKNLASTPSSSKKVLHEIGARLSLSF